MPHGIPLTKAMQPVAGGMSEKTLRPFLPFSVGICLGLRECRAEGFRRVGQRPQANVFQQRPVFRQNGLDFKHDSVFLVYRRGGGGHTPSSCSATSACGCSPTPSGRAVIVFQKRTNDTMWNGTAARYTK